MEIARGAEAILIKEGNKLIKKRLSKNYRIKEIDSKLIKSRTRRSKTIRKIKRWNKGHKHFKCRWKK